jgi:hypothetical protein
MHGPLNAKWTYYSSIKSVSLTVAHTTEYCPVSEANICSSIQAISFTSDAKVQQTFNKSDIVHESISPNLWLIRRQFKKMLYVSLIFLTRCLFVSACIFKLLN